MTAHQSKWYFLCALGLLFLTSSYLFPTTQSLQNDRSRSSITYKLVHRFHTIYGTSKQINSVVDLDRETQKIISVAVTIPVKSFDSGNRTRDKEMLKVTEAGLYPKVCFQSTNIISKDGKLAVEGKLSFHGVTKNMSFTAGQQYNKGEIIVKGQFVVALEDYNIKRPSILGMKVEDELTINFYIVYPLAT